MKKYKLIEKKIVAVQLPKRDTPLPLSKKVLDFLAHYELFYKIHSGVHGFTGLSVSKDGHSFTRLGPTRWLYVDYEEGIDGGVGDMHNDYFRESYEEANNE